MEALILAAGLGTRLRPETLTKPKCLVEVGGKTILEHTSNLLGKYGIKKIVVNVSYLADQIQSYFGSKFLYLYEPELLGTAGSIKAAGKWMDGDFVVMNGDTITNVNLYDMVYFHQKFKSSVTVLWHDKNIMDEESKFRGAGTMIFNQSFMSKLPDRGMIDDYLIRGSFTEYYQSDLEWIDIGTKEKLEFARQYYSNPKISLSNNTN